MQVILRLILLSAILSISISLASALTPTPWHRLTSDYSFDLYMKEHGKVYADSNEREMRRLIFEANLKMVLQHNQDETKTWKMGINHLSDRTDEEFKQLNGYNKRLAASRKAARAANPSAFPYAEDLKPLTPEEEEKLLATLPAAVDWREKGVLTAVKDQGACGSCWSFGTAETVESYWALATGRLTDLSEQQILDCTPNPQQCGGTGGCAGGTAEIAYEQLIVQGGLSSEWTYPYRSHFGDNFACTFNASRTVPMTFLSGYKVLPSNQYAPVLAHLATKGPLAISVDASSWQNYAEGVFDGCNQTNPDIDHEVQLVGFGTDPQLGDYWLVRNSWTPVWGEQGYIRLKRSSKVECGIDLHPSDGTGCINGPSQVTVCGTCGVLYDTNYPVIRT